MIQKRPRDLESLKFKEKKKKKLIGIVIIYFLTIIFVFLVALFVLRLSFIQISNIDFEGPSSISQKEIESDIFTILKESGKIIPGTNIFFFPKSQIEKEILSKWTNIDSIKIKRNGLSSIKIFMTERVPKALVCEGFHTDDSFEENKCFYTDKNGYVFAMATTTKSDYIRFYIVSNKDEKIEGTNFIDSKKFEGLERIVEGVYPLGLIPTGILIGENDQYEMYVQGKGPNSEIIIYFDDKVPFEKTLSNLTAFWINIFSKAKSKATTTPDFNFINLRYGNNIFYSPK